MSEPIKATTHYGDFNGTVSLGRADMAGGDLLWTIAHKVKIPRGYTPVGFGVHAGGAGWEPLHDWSLIVYAVDDETLGKPTQSEFRELIRGRDSIPVFEFSDDVEPEWLVATLLKHAKEFNLVLASRLLEDIPMKRVLDS